MQIKITDKKIIDINPLNSRVLSLDLQNLIPVEVREQYSDMGHIFLTDKILQLNFLNKKQIKLGDKLNVGGLNYTVNSIEPGNNLNYLLIDVVFNKCTHYLLPLIAENNKSASNYLTNYFLYNAYLYCDKYPQYSNGEFLFLCYKFIDNATYKKLETELISQRNFVEIIEPNKTYTIFVFEIDRKYNFIVEQFLQGKYHNFHKSVKDQILAFYDIKNNGKVNYYIPMYNRINSALSNSKVDREKLEMKLKIELPADMNWESKPNIKEETLKL